MMDSQPQIGQTSPLVLGIGGALVILGVIGLLFVTGVFNKTATTVETETDNQVSSSALRPEPTEPALPLAELIDNTNLFSIDTPDDWLSEANADGTGYTFFNTDQFDSSELIFGSVRTIDFGQDILAEEWQLLIDTSREGLAAIGDISLIRDEALTNEELGGRAEAGHVFEYILQSGGISLYQLQHIYSQDQRSYVLSAQSRTESWPRFANTINAMYDSFKVIN